MGTDRAASPSVERLVTGHGGNPPGQGPFMTLQLVIQDGVIRKASYETYQCPGTRACGQAICGMVTGRTVEEARAIRHDSLANQVGPLPPHRRHGYGLALLALADALGSLEKESKEH